jgi:ABC-type multidrug transport system fused ATPase/permease subunit
MNTSVMTSLALKTASMVLMISTAVDVLFALLPYQPSEISWWSIATAEVVNRGVLLLVGIVFWSVANWIETVSRDGNGRGNDQGKLAMAILSTALGVIFLIISPFQAWNASSEREKTVAKNKEEETQSNAQIERGINQIKPALASIEAQIKEGKLQGVELEKLKAEKAELEKLNSDPKALQERTTKIKEIVQSQRKKKDDQATQLMWKTGIRSALASLFLSASYGFIGLMGLRGNRR